MDIKLKPERKVLWTSTTACYRAALARRLPKQIDCFEVFIEYLLNLLARASTWSSYKHHNIVKVLLAIAPQGCGVIICIRCMGR